MKKNVCTIRMLVKIELTCCVLRLYMLFMAHRVHLLPDFNNTAPRCFKPIDLIRLIPSFDLKICANRTTLDMLIHWQHSYEYYMWLYPLSLFEFVTSILIGWSNWYKTRWRRKQFKLYFGTITQWECSLQTQWIIKVQSHSWELYTIFG